MLRDETYCEETDGELGNATGAELGLYRGRALTAWDAEPVFVERAAKILRIPPEAIPWSAAARRAAEEEPKEMAAGFGPLWRSFPCVIPGHEGELASLYRGENGVVLYRCWHHARKWYYLAEVFASQHYGHAVKLSNRWGKMRPELAVWKLRLLVETGLAEPAPVELATLPTDASPILKKVYDGFYHLLRCRWLHTPNRPTPFTYRFAAAWCNVAQGQAREAIRELLERDIIRQDGRRGWARLYAPGAGAGEENPHSNARSRKWRSEG